MRCWRVAGSSSPPLRGRCREADRWGCVPRPSQPDAVERGHRRAPLFPAGHSPARGETRRANDDLLAIVRKVEALGTFLETDNGRNLLAGTKRAANILAAEEKKGTRIADAVDAALLHCA